jgi:hypothetical protein
MLLSLSNLGQAATDVMGKGAASGTNLNYTPAVAGHISGVSESLTILFWALVALAAVGLYIFLMKRAFPPRRFRRKLSKNRFYWLRENMT